MESEKIKKIVGILTVVVIISVFIILISNFEIPKILSNKLKVNPNEKSSIATIGGVEGPKAVYVSQSNTADLKKIKIGVINKSELEDGYYYTLELYNGSKKIIKHVDILFGFILTEEAKKKNSSSSFMLPAEPVDSNIDIKPNERRSFIVYWPQNIINEEMLKQDRINIDIIGYFEQIDVKYKFIKSGELDYFSKN